MNLLLNLLVGVQMLSALGMIGLILIQHGKGADMGAAFGSGSAGSLFGASGSANFLSRTTAGLAILFFACTLMLAYFSHARPAGGDSLLERSTSQPAPSTAPVGPASQIPTGAAPAPALPASAVPAAAASAPATAAPLPAASGAGQIPAR